MGQDAYEELLEALRSCIGLAFWPRLVSSSAEGAEASYKFEWPANMCKNTLLLDDFSGRLRSLVLTEMEGFSAPRVKRMASVPTLRDIYSASETEFENLIRRPSDLKRVLFDAYELMLRKRGVNTLVIVFDHLDRTPKIKRILLPKTENRPVVWPKDGETLFSGDHEFRNSIHEYIVTPNAKVLLWDYLATALLDEFCAERLPECCELIVWSGVYKGADMLTPFRVAKDYQGVITGPEPMRPSIDIPRFMCAEADLTIIYLVKMFLGKRNVVVVSRDNDFIPGLLSVYSQAVEEYNANRDTVPNPMNFGLYLTRKVKVQTKVPTSQIPNEVLENYLKKKRERIVVDANTIPMEETKMQEVPEQQQHPQQQQQDDDEDALDFLKPVSNSGGLSAIDIRTKMMSLSPAASKRQKPAAVGKSVGNPSKDSHIDISERVTEVIDLGHIFKVLWNAFYTSHGECKRCDPMDAFASICFMSGSDYYKKLYGLSWTSLCAVYLDRALNEKIGCMCPRDTAANNAGIKFFRLDYEAFTRLVSLGYARKLDGAKLRDKSDINSVRSFLKSRYEANKSKAAAKKSKQALAEEDASNKPARAARQPYAPPDRIEAYAARLAWVINYYTRSHQAGWTMTTGTETDVKTGESLYGYSLDKSVYAFAENVEGLRVCLKALY